MRKLTLNVEDLSVESFTINGGRRHGGTVRGYWEDAAALVPPPASMPEGTCVETCTSAYTGTVTCKWTCDDNTCGSCPSGPNDPRCVA